MSVTLKSRAPSGEALEAVFDPKRGMNLQSYKLGGLEVLDPSTRPDFDKRFAGLGALIGPHFHQRTPSLVPIIEDESKFPHIAVCKAEGRVDPFSHGIGRYAPWKAEATETSIKGVLTGKDTWNGVPLAAIEGQEFTMHFAANLAPDGLRLELSVVSETDSIVGIHYYYRLPEGKRQILSQAQNVYIAKGQRLPLPEKWKDGHQHMLAIDLNEDLDFTFFPYPDPLQGEIQLETSTHTLVTRYRSRCQESSWQLWHKKGTSFVCIEPISAQDPRHPNLTASSIDIHLEIKKN